MRITNILKWILLFIFVSSFPALSQWMKKNFPSDENLTIVRFISSDIGWVVSDKHIYKTNNNGNDWIVKDTVYSIWKGFYVINDSTIIVGDYSKGIRISKNGGDTWDTVDSTIQDVNSFMFLNNNLGFASGGGGDTANVYRTLDGGKSWDRITHFKADNNWADFSKVSFIDSLTGWAVTYGGLIYHSINGGFNWEFQDSTAKDNFNLPLRDIQFTSPDSGWAIGGIAGTSIILRTSDGGTNWSSYISPNNLTPSDPAPLTIASLREIHMINSQVGWIVGTSNGPAYILKTIDGGETWSDETPEVEIYGIESISMIDNLHGFAVSENGNFFETNNGGEVTEVISRNNQINNKFSLSQNYPNPFNPSTNINYSVPQKSFVTIKVYDILGKEVANILNEVKNSGIYNIEFNAENIPSGVYFYQLKSGSYIATKKMVLLK